MPTKENKAVIKLKINNEEVVATQGVNVTPADVINGKFFITQTGQVGIGSLTNYGNLQSKTVTPTNNVQEITPDTDFYGLSKVTVEAITNLQSKTVSPTTNSQEITPDDGYYGLSKVQIKAMPNLQSKIVTPTTDEQEITPDDGYYGLSQVIVTAIPKYNGELEVR